MTLHDFILLRLHQEREVNHAYAMLMIRLGVRMHFRECDGSITPPETTK